METQIKIFWNHQDGSRRIDVMKGISRAVLPTLTNEFAIAELYAVELQRKMEKWLAGEAAEKPTMEIEISFKTNDAALFFMLHDPDPVLDD